MYNKEELCRLEQSELVKLIEEGELVYFPCKVGDTLYVPCISNIMETKVTSVQIHNKVIIITAENYNEHNFRNDHAFYENDIGKIVFLTYEEAKQKLKELNGNEKE